MGFEQAAIPIEKEREFQTLRGAVDRVFTAPLAEKFLKALKGKNLQVRDVDGVLASGLIEKIDGQIGRPAKALYDSLPVTDQGQWREYYLERLEAVPLELREKFSSIYRSF